MTQNIKFVFHRVETIMGKGENFDNQHFILYHNVFKMLFPKGHRKLSLYGIGLDLIGPQVTV